MNEMVNHPSHYGGDTPYEVIKVLHAWGLEDDALLWNAAKYIARAKRKGRLVEDLKKACWYIEKKLERLKNEAQTEETPRVPECAAPIKRKRSSVRF